MVGMFFKYTFLLSNCYFKRDEELGLKGVSFIFRNKYMMNFADI
jgi:hypothetical protein